MTSNPTTYLIHGLSWGRHERWLPLYPLNAEGGGRGGSVSRAPRNGGPLKRPSQRQSPWRGTPTDSRSAPKGEASLDGGAHRWPRTRDLARSADGGRAHRVECTRREAPDGSYRYEVFVETTLDGQEESHLTAGGFEVQNGQILRP